MSIAKQLEDAITKLRVLIKRGNGDITEAAPAILDDLDAVIDQVRALETVAPITTTLLQDYQAKGGLDG